MACQAASSTVSPQFLFFLRFIQQGAIVLTAFVAIYFAAAGTGATRWAKPIMWTYYSVYFIPFWACK